MAPEKHSLGSSRSDRHRRSPSIELAAGEKKAIPFGPDGAKLGRLAPHGEEAKRLPACLDSAISIFLKLRRL